MRFLRLVAATLLSCFVVLSPVQAEDWLNWMGPKFNGVSDERNWSYEWPNEELEEVWSKEIGIGFSSVSIEGNRLYTMGFVEGNEFVYCLDSATGDVIWRHTYASKLNPNLHEGGPAATPTIHGSVVYTLGKEGQFYCLDKLTGEVKWHHELTKVLELPVPEWGFSSSPRILGDMVLIECGRVAAFNKTSGEKIWQTDQHKAGYGSVAVFEHSENGQMQTLLATLDCEGLRVLDSKSGQQLAFAEWESPFRTNSTTPIVQDSKIFISAGYNVGCGLFEFKNNELTKIYSSRKMRNHFNNSILWKGHVYGLDGNSNLGRVVRLTCLDFETGEVQWQQAGFGCGSLMIANGKLVILSDEGILAIADASPAKFVERARAPFLENRCWTVPVLLNGHIYGRNAAGLLKCVKLPK